MFGISPSARLRQSPYFESTLAEGVTSFTTYNNMLMPTSYGKPEEEYWRLINGVSQWDVAVERQVQLKGPDAGKLAQILAPRDLSKCQVGQGKYVPLCNHQGVLINDPILLKLADDLYWLSIADSNIWFWAGAIAAERGLRVEVSDPDVAPMAIQGPKAEDVIAHIFAIGSGRLNISGFVKRKLLEFLWFWHGRAGQNMAGLNFICATVGGAMTCGKSSKRQGSLGALGLAIRIGVSGWKAVLFPMGAIRMRKPTPMRCGWANMSICMYPMTRSALPRCAKSRPRGQSAIRWG